MKIFLFLFPFICLSVGAQDLKIKDDVSLLKTKIYNSKNGERLKLLDNLCTLVENKKEFKYDSIAEVTINYALQLDSLNIAAKNTYKLIFFKNNILYKHDQGLKIFKNFFQKINKIKHYNILGEFYLNGADSYYFTGDKKTALKYYEIAEGFALKVRNKKLAGTANLHMGFALKEMTNIYNSSKKLQKAKKYFNEIKDTTNIIAANYGLALLYSQNGFYIEAKKERDETIALAKASNDYINLALLYYNAAQDLRKTGHINECITNLLLAIEFEKKTGGNDYVYSEIICEILLAYLENNNIDAAEKYLKEINNNIDRFKNDENKENYLEVLKNIAFAHRNFNDALKLGKEHLEIEKRKFKAEKIFEAENFLSKVYKAIGDYKNAYYHENKYFALKDSLFSEQKLKYFSYYQSLYQTKKKDFLIESQKKDLEFLEKNSKSNKLLFIVIIGIFILVSIVIILIRSRNGAREKELLIHSFSQNLISNQEDERKRLARDLHDSIGQKLIVLYKKINGIESKEASLLCKNAIDELRTISHGLYPPQMEGISYTEAIKSLINEIDRNTKLFFTCDIETIDNLIDREHELHLYRIIQELLSNILKHSKAKAVFVSVEKQKKYINVTIEDNGHGFDVSKTINEKNNLGMKTLLGRAKNINAKLEFKSVANKGTIVQLIIPF